VPLELAPEASVSDVKAGLAQRLALPPSAAAAPNAIRLIFAGKLLVDGAILREAVAREVRAALPAAQRRVSSILLRLCQALPPFSPAHSRSDDQGCCAHGDRHGPQGHS
jgi:hypothetical protein